MITTALIVILISLLAYVVVKAYKTNQHWKKKGVKHLKPVLFLGNNLQMILGNKSMQDCMSDIYDAYPKESILGYYEFMSPKLFIRDTDLIDKILIKDFGHFTDHGLDSNFKKNPRDEQLFLMNGNRWRALRLKLTPIFTSGKLKEMFSTMTSVGENLLDYLRQRENEEVDIRELMGLFSMDVISSAVFGMDPATLKNPDCEFRDKGRLINDQSIKNLMRVWMLFAFPKLMNYLGFSFQRKELTDYFCNIIQNAFDYRKEKGIQRNDFIQMMMQLKEKGKVEVQSWDTSDDYLKSDVSEPTKEQFELNDDLLMAQAQAFLIAGFEATALIMAYTTFELTQHQDIQDKICQEIKEQVKLQGGLSYDALKNMRLLEGAIKETQRIYPLVPSLFRVCTKTYELSNGYVIKKGDPITIPVAAVHMDPNNFPDPKQYKPERFLEPMKPGIFLPFGEGPRMCIAMRYAMMVVKYGLAIFFLNYKVKLSPKTSVPLKFNNRAFGVLPVEKILIHLEKIKS